VLTTIQPKIFFKEGSTRVNVGFCEQSQNSYLGGDRPNGREESASVIVILIDTE
jgi:hypothetical protein